jgi:hypothetical protein
MCVAFKSFLIIRKQVLKTYVNTIFYGSEAWTMNKVIEKQLEATDVVLKKNAEGAMDT